MPSRLAGDGSDMTFEVMCSMWDEVAHDLLVIHALHRVETTKSSGHITELWEV